MKQLFDYPSRFVQKANANHWNISMFGFVTITVSAFLIGGLFGWMISGVLTGVVLGFFMAYMVPFEWLERVSQKSLAHKQDVLINAVRSVQNAYTATGNLVSAIEMSLPMMEEPATSAFRKVLALERTGVNLSEAMEHLRQVFPFRELDFLIHCADTMKKSGGQQTGMVLERFIRLLEDARSREEQFKAEIAARNTESRHLFVLFLMEVAVFKLFDLMNPDLPIGGPMMDVIIAIMLMINIVAWLVYKQMVQRSKRYLI